MKEEYLIQACMGKRVDVFKGQTITVIDVSGGQVADFFAESLDNAEEFLSTGVTMDCNESLRLKVGDFIYSNLYRPMFQIVEDEVGMHDLLHPCCRPEMYDFFYQNGKGHPNCHDTINRVLGESRAMICPVNLFMNSQIDEEGTIKVKPPLSKAGDKIVFRAEIDVRVGIAACSVAESPCNSGVCTSIQVIVDRE